MDMTTNPMRMSTTDFIDDPYFGWLCHKVDIGGPEHPYNNMAMALHELSFRPAVVVHTDLNRANDGLRLRVDFMERYGASGSSTNRGPCTMLEFIIGLAKRMSFLMGEEDHPSKTPYYFWRIIGNLGLMRATDSNQYTMFLVEDAVNHVLDRSYEASGVGGLFPLKHPSEDQRKVEIWYQMQAWLSEHCAIDIE